MKDAESPDIESRRDFLFQSIRRLAGFGSKGPESSGIGEEKNKPASGRSKPQTLWLNRHESMAYAPLGKTGFMVSRFVLGTRDLPTLGQEGLRVAVEAGVNLILTSAAWLKGETNLAEKLSPYAGRIWKSYVSSEQSPVCGSPSPTPSRPALFNGARFWEEIEAAQRAFGGGRVELMLFAGLNDPGCLKDAAFREAVHQAQRENRILHAGLALDPPEEFMLEAAIESDWIDALLLPFNALNFSNTGPLINEATERGIGVLSARTTRGIVEQAGESSLGLMELPEDMNAHEMAYLYMIKNGPQAGFLCHFGEIENLRRDLALCGLALDFSRANELDAVVDDEIWPNDDLMEILNP